MQYISYFFNYQGSSAPSSPRPTPSCTSVNKEDLEDWVEVKKNLVDSRLQGSPRNFMVLEDYSTSDLSLASSPEADDNYSKLLNRISAIHVAPLSAATDPEPTDGEWVLSTVIPPIKTDSPTEEKDWTDPTPLLPTDTTTTTAEQSNGFFETETPFSCDPANCPSAERAEGGLKCDSGEDELADCPFPTDIPVVAPPTKASKKARKKKAKKAAKLGGAMPIQEIPQNQKISPPPQATLTKGPYHPPHHVENTENSPKCEGGNPWHNSHDRNRLKQKMQNLSNETN